MLSRIPYLRALREALRRGYVKNKRTLRTCFRWLRWLWALQDEEGRLMALAAARPLALTPERRGRAEWN